MGTQTGMETTIGAALFGTVRRRVLGLLFREWERDFYQREIVEAVGCGSGAVQRELKQLTAAGIITRSERGKLVFYQANHDSPVFDDLHGLIMKTSGMAEVLREILESFSDSIEVAFIFGAVAEGADHRDRSVDLMVIGEIGLQRLGVPLFAAEVELNRKIEATIWSADDLREKLADEEHFASAAMQGPKVFVSGDEDALRRVTDGAATKGSRLENRASDA